MKFTQTPIAGVWLIALHRQEDERGFFARTYCERAFAAHGIHERFVQSNISYNRAEGTLRGMHYQTPEHPESKVVSCVRGAIFDAAADLRPGSPTFGQWYGARLDAESHHSLYLAPGIAHGFLTLTPDAEVHYLMGGFYVPEAARGLRWDDPLFAIDWPGTPKVISERDRNYPDFAP